MHRYGLAPPDVAGFLELIRSEDGLRAEGIWSHFAVAEDVLNPYTRQQFECFTGVLAGLGPAADGLMRHLANSAGLLTFPEAHFDMVRTGIAELPENERRVILLGYAQDLSQAEIAERLEWPLGTVKSRTRRAMAQLRGRLGAITDGADPGVER